QQGQRPRHRLCAAQRHALRGHRRGRYRPRQRQDLGAQVHRRPRLRPDHQPRWAEAHHRGQRHPRREPHLVGGGQVRRQERDQRRLDDLPDPRHHRDAGDDRRGADQPSRAAAHRRRRAVDPPGCGGDCQRDLRRHRRAHPPRAVLARPGEAVAVVTSRCEPLASRPIRSAPSPRKNGERERTSAWLGVRYTFTMIARSLEEALAPITDGCVLAVPREASGVAMAATRALIRRGVKRLNLIALPTSSLQADLLIGAGCVETIETSAVSLGEFGPAPRFTAAVTSGAIRVKDATCPALHAAFQAAEKGVPFMPLRGLIGSDVLAHRKDWKVVDNPFGNNDPIVLLPAIKPDVALFHAPLADREGNVWIGRDRELATMAHAAAKTVVTVEQLYEGNLFDDPSLAAGALGGFYVQAIAAAPKGAWPLGLADHYGADAAHLAEYARMAASGEGFAAYLDRHVHAQRAA